jgi:hypothetical protein
MITLLHYNGSGPERKSLMDAVDLSRSDPETTVFNDSAEPSIDVCETTVTVYLDHGFYITMPTWQMQSLIKLYKKAK